MSVSWFADPRINTELLDQEPPKQRNRINHRPVDGIVVARRREVLDAHKARGWLADRARSTHHNHAVRRLGTGVGTTIRSRIDVHAAKAPV
jgi:hypothetical protein